jgi:hypothetical protein
MTKHKPISEELEYTEMYDTVSELARSFLTKDVLMDINGVDILTIAVLKETDYSEGDIRDIVDSIIMSELGY